MPPAKPQRTCCFLAGQGFQSPRQSVSATRLAAALWHFPFVLDAACPPANPTTPARLPAAASNNPVAASQFQNLTLAFLPLRFYPAALSILPPANARTAPPKSFHAHRGQWRYPRRR